MNEIKIYETMSYIHTYDDKIYPTPLELDVINSMLERWKFINLWTDLINVSNIKRVESRKIDSVENAILQIEDLKLREKVMVEVKKRESEWKTTNTEILKNILDRLSDKKWS